MSGKGFEINLKVLKDQIDEYKKEHLLSVDEAFKKIGFAGSGTWDYIKRQRKMSRLSIIKFKEAGFDTKKWLI